MHMRADEYVENSTRDRIRTPVVHVSDEIPGTVTQRHACAIVCVHMRADACMENTCVYEWRMRAPNQVHILATLYTWLRWTCRMCVYMRKRR